MKIEINRSTKIASISGGDAGPGTGDDIGQGNNYKWKLPISQIEPDSTKQQLVTQTLGEVMAFIGGVAQSSCQSVSFVGGGDYDGVHFSIGGSSELTMGQGQLQSHGSEIDISGADHPPFSHLSKLPVGTLAASPVPGVTTWDLVITIK